MPHIHVWSVVVKSVHIQATTLEEESRLVGGVKVKGLFIGVRKSPKKGMGYSEVRIEDCTFSLSVHPSSPALHFLIQVCGGHPCPGKHYGVVGRL